MNDGFLLERQVRRAKKHRLRFLIDLPRFLRAVSYGRHTDAPALGEAADHVEDNTGAA